MTLLTEVLGEPGVFPIINSVYKSQAPLERAVFDRMSENAGMANSTKWSLLNSGLFDATSTRVNITTFGQRVALLMRVLNDKEELGDAIRKFSVLYPQLKSFDLITDNITDFILDSINLRRDFIRLFICSPWIRLEQRQWEKFHSAYNAASSKYTQVQILVITLPEKDYKDRYAWSRTISEFRKVSAQIVVRKRLHAKLYISDPGPRGGTHYAVFGSENLTGAGNVELGIKVENDNEILSKLTRYFREVQAESELL